MTAQRSTPEARTVVLVGGGHAHVQVLRRWAMDPPANARLLVVLDRPVAVYSGMVPGFVAGDYPTHALEIDVVPLARRAGAGVLFATATDVDPVAHTLALEGRPPIEYDVLSIDVGSTVRGLDLPGVREHALATRPIGRFVAALDERVEALAQGARPPRIALVGGGAAGCEIAFTLDARLRTRGVAASISIVFADDVLLPGASRATRRLLEREALARGIALHGSRRVERVEAGGLIVRPAPREDADRGTRGATPPVDGDAVATSRLEADLVVWATGAAPVAFPAHAGASRLATDGAGFLEVRETLQTVGHDDVFAVGDCARMVDHRWVPRAGVYAVRQGPILEANLRAWLDGRALRRYRPQRDFLSLLNLGGGRALGSKWGLASTGRAVYRLKDWIDRRFMARFQVLDASGRPNEALARLGAMGDDEPMACGGCAAKLGASPLASALAALPKAPADDSVVLGLDERDDVAATRLDGERTLLHNVDVIRAFADDPWLTGRVAASNALSDLYAKGGTPTHAQAIVTLPDWPARVARAQLVQVLSGLRSILDPAGVSLLGGHTTLGDDLAVGLAVTGEGPEASSLLRQQGAGPGDALLLTKPIGTGVVLAADAQGRARGAWVEAAHASMQRTNEAASRVFTGFGPGVVHAATDVTGFGLAGHLLGLLDPPGRVADLDREALPCLPGARRLWRDGLRSTAHPANAGAFASRVSTLDEGDEAWLYDPQTAGGLLAAIAAADAPRVVDALAAVGVDAVRIGEIAAESSPGGRIRVR